MGKVRLAGKTAIEKRRKSWRISLSKLVGDEQTRIFDKRFVRTIDANDNGVLPEADTISLAVDSFMPNWDEAGSADDAFEAAVNWAQTVLERFIARMQSAVKAENIVQTAIEQADDPRIVVLDTFAPWEPGSREMRIHFPEEWAKNKPQGVNFIHQARFLIATDSKEDAVRLCRQAIDEQS